MLQDIMTKSNGKVVEKSRGFFDGLVSDGKIFVDADKTKLRRELDGYNNTGYYYKLGTNLFLYEFMGNIDKICTARN
jgi:hypothetical protein